VKLKFFKYLARDHDAGNLLENFLVSAVVSLLTIRFFLFLTGYPTLGDGKFHIAHMLWGGLLMFVALFANMMFLTRKAKYFAAIVGGVGFGAFIDELGKFITSDNDYFFEPTIALIYVCFVLIFITARLSERYFRLTSEEYAVNALDMAKEAVVNDLDIEEKKKALHFIKLADSKDPTIRILNKLLQDFQAVEIAEPNFFVRTKHWVNERYKEIIQKRIFIKLVIYFFVLKTVVGFVVAGVNIQEMRTFADYGEVFSLSLSATLVIVGIYQIKKGRRALAFESFKMSVLVSIFLTQFFLFYKHQLSALTGFAINIVVLSVLQYLLGQENQIRQEKVGTLSSMVKRLFGSSFSAASSHKTPRM
jgi:hypothetical protein